MKSSRWNKRFLTSTRGRIIALLRAESRTASELAETLGLTDNAVRAHLARLERDGLVQHQGLRRGLRKPHYAYELTPEADYLFPKAYGPLLNQLLSLLKERLDSQEIEVMLREMGQRLAAPHAATVQARDLEQRMDEAVRALNDLGGLAEIERHDGHLFIRGDSCPLTAVSEHHPEVCRMAETLLSEIIQVPVQERCKRGESPRCCFEIKVN